MNFVIRLPGAGRINLEKKTNNVPWTGYRNYSIDTVFYFKIKELLLELQKQNHNIVLVSGGIGAFLYSDFSINLGLGTKTHKTAGIRIVNVLNDILLEFFKENKLNIFDNLVKSPQIKDLIGLDDTNLFIVEADENYISTDSLCADIAKQISADSLIYFKEGAPSFFAGFSEETKLTKWKIDDMANRADYYGSSDGDHYVLDINAIRIIKEFCLKTFIINPKNPEDIRSICEGTSSQNQCYTELVH